MAKEAYMKNLTKLSLTELRQMWAEAWKKKPSERLGRVMLERSLFFILESTITQETQNELDKLVKSYKRNSKRFDERCCLLKPGTLLIRSWKGKKHTVIVRADGFDFHGRHYTSLSQIANDITGTRWNGHLFFGLKKKDCA